jgi:hypothetical protein
MTSFYNLPERTVCLYNLRCHDVASLNCASLNYPSLEKLDEASLGLCVPRTFCPWPFCDNMSPLFGADHPSPFGPKG